MAYSWISPASSALFAAPTVSSSPAFPCGFSCPAFEFCPNDFGDRCYFSHLWFHSVFIQIGLWYICSFPFRQRKGRLLVLGRLLRFLALFWWCAGEGFFCYWRRVSYLFWAWSCRWGNLHLLFWIRWNLVRFRGFCPSFRRRRSSQWMISGFRMRQSSWVVCLNILKSAFVGSNSFSSFLFQTLEIYKLRYFLQADLLFISKGALWPMPHIFYHRLFSYVGLVPAFHKLPLASFQFIWWICF